MAHKVLAIIPTNDPATTANTSADSTTTVRATRTLTETQLPETTQMPDSSGNSSSGSSVLTDPATMEDAATSGSRPTTLRTSTLPSPTNGDPRLTASPSATPLSGSHRKVSAAVVDGVSGAVTVALVVLCLFLYIVSSRRKKKKDAECKKASIEKGACSGTGGGGETYPQELLGKSTFSSHFLRDGHNELYPASPTLTKDYGGPQTPVSPGFPAPAYTAHPNHHAEEDPVPHLDSQQILPDVELPGAIPLPHPPSNVIELANSEVASPITTIFKFSGETPLPPQEPSSASLCRLSNPPSGPDWTSLDSTNAGIMASRLSTTTEANDHPKSDAAVPKPRSPAPGMISGPSLSPPATGAHVMAWADYCQVDGVETEAPGPKGDRVGLEECAVTPNSVLGVCA
jgi:hypothetical protein